MDNANIESPQGKTLGTNVPFTRLPVEGEWIAVGNKWQKVTGVFHRWQNNLPLAIIRISESVAALDHAHSPEPDDFISDS